MNQTPPPPGIATLFANHIPLTGNDPVNRRDLPAHGGVYAFTGESDHLIQLISTQNIRRSAVGRLQPPPDGAGRKRTDVRSIARKIWWTPAYSVFESSLVYLNIARRLHADEYQDELAFGPVWFASVNSQDRLPRWRVEKYAFKPGRRDVGPFDRRPRCLEFIELLEELFDLCRYHHILEQAPHGEPCAYFDMGKCPAPCDGTISLDRYREMIRDSLRFATGDYENRLNELQSQMTRASEKRDFVVAGRLRDTIARARKTIAQHGPITATPEDFRFLIVQRGEKPSRVKPFFVDRGRIADGESAPREVPAETAEQWIDRLRSIEDSRDKSSTDVIDRSECIWLVAHFLSKGDNAPGLFVHARDLTTADKLIASINVRLRPRGKELR